MTDVQKLLDEATPLPWRLITDKSDPEGSFPVGIERDHPGYPGEHGWAVMFDDDWGTNQWANAALIVHAVNSLPDYEAAVDALEWTMGWIDDSDIDGEQAEQARAVLRRLREQVPA